MFPAQVRVWAERLTSCSLILSHGLTCAVKRTYTASQIWTLKYVLLTDRRTVYPDLLFLLFTIQVPLVSSILFLPVMTADVTLFRYRNASLTHQKKPFYSLSGSVCCLVIHSKFCLCRQFSVAVMQCFSFLLHH